jgi:hypothetical protein
MFGFYIITWAIINTYFRKREEHYITYKSERSKSHIDYFMWKRDSTKRVNYRKIIPGESVITQYKLMIIEGIYWVIQ